jgi:hydrogenase nickel incorporation protein HypA/HybF
MHELSITRNIVAIAGEAAHGRRVTRVTIEVGALSGIMADAIAFCFGVVAEGTAVQGAALDIHSVEGRARCEDCGTEFATNSWLVPCGCGSRRLARLHGEELMVKAIEIEEME